MILILIVLAVAAFMLANKLSLDAKSVRKNSF